MSLIIKNILAAIASLLSTTQVNRDFLEFNKKRLNIHKTRIDGAWEETAKNREFLRHNKKRLNIHEAKIADLETRSGIKGDKGDQGFTGRPGVDGLDGQNGNDGTDGAPGAKGDKGDAGNNGAPGLDGTNGQDGRDGADGAAGPGRWGLYKNGTKLGTILPLPSSQTFIVSDKDYIVTLNLYSGHIGNKYLPGTTYTPRFSLATYTVSNSGSTQTVTRSRAYSVTWYTGPNCTGTTYSPSGGSLVGKKIVKVITNSDGEEKLFMQTDIVLEDVVDNISSRSYGLSCYAFDQGDRDGWIQTPLLPIFAENDPAVSGFDNEIIEVPLSESEIK